MTFPRTKIEAKLARAMRPVGRLAGDIIENLLIGRYSGGALPSPERALTEFEMQLLVTLAAQIEVEATFVVARMMYEHRFRDALLKELSPEQARRIGRLRSDQRTKPFEAALRAASANISLKEFLRDLEKKKQLLDRGVNYEIAGTGKMISKASMASKISRLRRKLSRA